MVVSDEDEDADDDDDDAHAGDDGGDEDDDDDDDALMTAHFLLMTTYAPGELPRIITNIIPSASIHPSQSIRYRGCPHCPQPR